MADRFENTDIPTSIRINPYKSCDLSHLQQDSAVPWSPFGRYLGERPVFTLDPLFHAGAYYVQDASAMFVGWMFRKVLELFPHSARVLDLCAAPGGKTTDAASSLRELRGNDFVLFANEVIRQRSAVLQDNVARWGDPNVVVTSSDPSDFQRLEGFFDIVIADVPCSGEGMFRKSENARQMWSEDNVELCRARQRRIVADAWNSLREGGVLIYSTCTLNDAENDDNVRWISEELGAGVLRFEMPFEGPERTEYGFRLVPGVVRGEGQYCAALVKGGACPKVELPQELDEPGQPAEALPSPLQFFDRDGDIYALTPAVADAMQFVGKRLNVICAGVHSFTLKGKDRIPDADLSLSLILDQDDFPCVELPLQQALSFLHRDAMILPDAPLGYVAVTYQGLPLGFVKNLGKRANNLHPMPRRILMNI